MFQWLISLLFLFYKDIMNYENLPFKEELQFKPKLCFVHGLKIVLK